MSVHVGSVAFLDPYHLLDLLRYYRPQALHETPPKFSTYELEEKLWSLSEKLVQEYL